MATKPYAGRSEDRVLGLANVKNATEYQLGIDFNWGAVEPASAPAGRNSRIEVKSLRDTHTDQWLYYRRQPPAEIDMQPEGNVVEVEIPNYPFTIHEILPLLNAALSLDLQEHEVEDTTFTDQQASYPLTFKAGGLAWLPGVYNFRVKLDIPPNVRLVDTAGTKVRITGANGSYRVRK